MIPIPWQAIASFALKRLPQIIGVLVIVFGLLWAAYSLVDYGRDLERAEWLDKQVKQQEKEIAHQKALAAEIGLAMERVAAQNKETVNNTLRVIDEKDTAINMLHSDLADARRMRVSFKETRTCSSDSAMSGQADSEQGHSGSSGGPAITINDGIHPEVRVTERSLIDGLTKAHEEIEMLKIHLVAATEQLKPLVEVAGDE